MCRTIQITGKGMLKIKPDQILLKLSLSKTLESYEEAIKKSVEEVNEVKQILEEAGLDKKELKTTYYSIKPDYESVRDNKGNYVTQLKGYKYNQDLNYKFDIDNKILGKVLYSLSKSTENVQIDLEYTIKNPEEAKNELLKMAVEDAYAKAKILSESAQVRLGKILKIDFSSKQIDFSSKPFERGMMLSSKMCAIDSIDIEPEDITKNEDVTIIWEIE